MLFGVSCKATVCITANFVFYFVNGKQSSYLFLLNSGTLCLLKRDETTRSLFTWQYNDIYIKIRIYTARLVYLHQDSYIYVTICVYTSRFVSLNIKVHLTRNFFFAKIIRLILWSNFAQKCFDLVKSSNCYAPSKPSFRWFATAQGESGES